MEDLIQIIALLILIIGVLLYCLAKVISNSKRLSKLEQTIQQFNLNASSIEQAALSTCTPRQKSENISPPKYLPNKEAANNWHATATVTAKNCQKISPKSKSQQSTSTNFEISTTNKNKSNNSAISRKTLFQSNVANWLRDNWTGFLGVTAVVMGLSFIGLYIGFFASPLIRCLMLLGVGSLFIFLAIILRLKKPWQELGGWIQAGGGVIILLALMGGSYFDSLMFNQDPRIGFILLSTGLAINIALAYYKPAQAISATHVMISLLVLGSAPQIPQILWAGSLVTLCGILLSYRNTWNFNLILSLISFSALSFIWQSGNSIDNHSHGIATSLLVFVPALLVHFRTLYKAVNIKQSSLTHLMTWGLFGFNLFLFQTGIQWTIVSLALGACLSIMMCFYAKRNKIDWLFNIDYVVSEFILALALISLIRYQVEITTIFWFITLVTASFLILSLKQNLTRVIPANIILFVGALLIFSGLIVSQATTFPHIQAYLVLFAMLYAGQYLAAYQAQSSDSQWFNKGQLTLTIAMLFIGAVTVFPMLIKPQALELWLISLLLVLMLQNKVQLKLHHHHMSLNIFITGLTLAYWLNVYNFLSINAVNPARYLITQLCSGVLPIFIVLLALPCRKALYFAKTGKWHNDLGMYLLGLHIALFLIVLVHPYNAFLPGLLFLALSIISLELRRQCARATAEKQHLLAIAFNNLGLWSFLFFVGCFMLNIIHAQTTLFYFFSIRVLIALLGISSGITWLIQKKLELPHYQRKIIDHTLGFDLAILLIIGLIVLESTAPYHGIAYSILAFALLHSHQYAKWLPNRRKIYSTALYFATLVHVPIVSSQWASPLSNWYEYSHITGPIALLCAFFVARSLSQQSFVSSSNLSRWQRWTSQLFDNKRPLKLYLPLFISLAFFLYWRFDAAVLTVLWVAEVLIMVILGLNIKQKSLIQASYLFLLMCLVRLVIHDFAQSNLLMRAFVFIMVGLFMISIHVTYKKMSGRLES